MNPNCNKVKSNAMTKWLSQLLLVAISLTVGTASAQTIGGSVFGGGRMADVDGNAYVEMKAGAVQKSIFGGNDISGHTGNGTSSFVPIAEANAEQISAGTAVYGVNVTGGTVTENVFGGANGFYACHEAETNSADGYASINYTGSNFTDENVVDPVKKIPALNYTSVLISTSGSVNNVYGGGNLAPVGYQGISTGSTSVNIFKGNITGNVFTGGNMASVYVPSSLKVDNTITEGSDYADLTIAGGVYGGNDKSGTVSIARTGEHKASDNTTVIPNTATYVLIKGAAQIGGVYGAGNGDYDYDDDWNECSFEKPDQPAGSFVDINTTGGYIGIVCGGGNSASVGGDSYVLLNTKSETSTANNGEHDGKHVGVIYGGCNKANVTGSTHVDLAQAKVETIYGGCNISGDVTVATNVNVHGGLVTDAVFGGANGYYGCEGANGNYAGDFDEHDGVTVYSTIKMPTVKTTNVSISGGQIGTDSKNASVYGGGNLASVKNSTGNGVANLTMSAGTVYGSVYGGGNMASVEGYTNFHISGGDVNGDVYGGNDKTGVVTGDGRTGSSTTAAWADAEHGIPTSYALTPANAASYVKLTGTPKITGSVFGGGNGDYTYYTDKATYDDATEPNKVFTCSTSKPVQSSAFVDINVDCAAHIGNVFAGGNNATVGSTTPTTESSTDAVATVYMNVTANPLADPSTCSNTQIGTIFGGNNKATMNVVPKIDLRQGKVGNVYGGGNMGGMNGRNSSLDADQQGLALSTYVRIPSPNVEVAENVYGGCKAADVTNQTYVYLDKGQVDGKIFGANDIAGNVGTANVIIDGVSVVNEVYGGGNGDYCYIEAASFNLEAPMFSVTDHGTTFTNLSGRPTTSTAKVEVRGAAKVHMNIYGGGLAGDCENTIVNLDLKDDGATDDENGILYGMVFGGGRGDINSIGKKASCVPAKCNDAGAHAWHTHVGNVTGTATLNINTIGKMMTETTVRGTTRNAIFGGGHAGDVANAVVNLNTTCKAHIPSIYGGCLASDLSGTTTMNINGATTLPQGSSYNVDTLYGGNDYAGITNITRMTVNSGTFLHVFGAGNGEYNYWRDPRITALGQSSTCADTVPYSMDVMVTFNGGTVQSNVYGGGNLGLVGNRDLNPSNIVAADYGKIVVNVHDGTFNRHIFTGARGTKAMNKKFFGHGSVGDPTISGDATLIPQHLAYATKELNMDGGYVKFSVYGGSESVDDGFFWECVGNDSVGSGCSKHYTNSSLRPSSILNIVGGEINKNVYGGGYQGNIYGSVYVNIGYHAVHDSPVWTKHYGKWVVSADAGSMPSYVTFEDYKPWVLDIQGRPFDYVPKQTDLTASRVTLGASVYNGSDWGEAGSNAYFYTRGFYGGESNILIDGNGYYTSLTNAAQASLPGMNINYSIIGAGTSTEGGDINRLITFKNYGDYECPNLSKTIYSIQRADKVILDHVYINLSGDQDAYSAYVSPSYSFCRIDTLIFQVDNIVEMSAPGIYIGNLVSMKDRLQSCDITSPEHLYATTDIYPPTHDCGAASDCSTLDFCDLLPSNRGTAYDPASDEPIIAAANTLVMKNGSYMKVSPFIDKKVNATDADGFDGLDDKNHPYGHVQGYMYLMAQDNTQSYVYAAEKINSTSIGYNDEGFVSTCKCDNQLGSDDDKELSYTNVSGVDVPVQYRSWKVGTKQGTRTRHITIIANANPDDRQNFSLTGNDAVTGHITTNANSTPADFNIPGHLAYATASLELPPSEGGSFYIINSISIDRDNGGQITMVDNTFDLKSTTNLSQPQAYGLSNPATNISEIATVPNTTFGMMFSSGENFASGCWAGTTDGFYDVPTDGSNIEHRQIGNNGSRYNCWTRTVISGNNFISSQDGYISNTVASGSGVIPTLDFVLTYSKDLSTTLTRDVVFTMYEFDKDGKYIGPIDVTVTIATVVNSIDNLEAPVLAMYNEGNYNEYVRKVTIPATFYQKQLYLEGIEWHEEEQVVSGFLQTKVTESEPQILSTVTRATVQGDVHGEVTQMDPGTPSTVDGVTTTVDHYTIVSTFIENGQTTITTSTYDVTTTTRQMAGTNTDSSWFRMQGVAAGVPADQRHFSIKVSPTESTSDNVNNTLGWYHIEERNLDVFALANDDYKDKTGNVLTDDVLDKPNSSAKLQQLNNYDSWDFTADGNATTNDYTKLKDENRLWIGTLDGRATASMDVTLGFNGSLFYEDQYAVPLAWATLHFVAINTNASDDGSHEEQHFDLKVKIRTRSEGDTIYLAPDSILTRTVVTSAGVSQPVILTSFEKQQIDYLKKIHTTWSYQQCHDARLTGLNVEDDKRIKNNPARYVQSFKAAMMTFVEGDVLDIMETLTIDDGSNPISVSGEDYSMIPIIRYSGSHCRFPGLGCAHYGPMIVVSGDGMLSMRNVTFNGSGLTRVKAESPAQGGESNKAGIITQCTTQGFTTYMGYGPGQSVPDASDICLKVGNIYFNENHGPNGAIGTREKTILFADAPMIVVTGNGTINFSKNVTLTNNFSKAQNPGIEFTGEATTDNIDRAQRAVYGGGAICLKAETFDTTWIGTGSSRTVESISINKHNPQLILGDMTNIYDNIVVDWSNVPTLYQERHVSSTAQATTARESGSGPHNYGAGVYVDGGTLTLGTGAADMAINIKRNYYLQDVPTISEKKFVVTNVPIVSVPKMGKRKGVDYPFTQYQLDTTRDENHAGKLALSNVYLMRTPGIVGSGSCSEEIAKVRTDQRSDLAYFNNTFAEGSSVGISKWFPGYNPWDLQPRDTIAFARIAKGKSDASVVDKVYSAGVFFNDSAYFHQTDLGDLAFKLDDVNPNKTLYWSTQRNSVTNNDLVYLFHHSTVNQYNLYFQRCATFGKGVTQDLNYCTIAGTNQRLTNFVKVYDSIYYRWDPQATCSGNTDTLFFRLGGGFFPYSYQWIDMTGGGEGNLMRERFTTGTAAISNNTVPSNAALRRKSEVDSLTMVDMILPPGKSQETFTYLIKGNDLTGHCEVSQQVQIKVVQNLDVKTYTDVDNFLGHGNTYVMLNPGLDSSNFHDHSFTVNDQTIYGYPTTTLDSESGQRTSTSLTRTLSSNPKYLRTYKLYSIHPSIYPVAYAANAAKPVEVWSNNVEIDWTVTANNSFCPGDVVELRPKPVANKNFVMWDYDASANETSNFVVSSDESLNYPVAYYEPNDYWWQVVTSQPAGYQEAYNGDVTITTNEGLAWLISVVNGYNGQEAHTFRFDQIKINATNLDMSAHKWTPLGAENNHFEGTISSADTTHPVLIHGIIANESSIPYMGVFGYTDNAKINNLAFRDVFIKGNHYVGGLVGRSTFNTEIRKVNFNALYSGDPASRDANSFGATLVGTNCIGGVVGTAANTKIDNCGVSDMKLMGNCIYVGGVAGRTTPSESGAQIENTFTNNSATAVDQSRLAALYAGGAIGFAEPGAKRGPFAAKNACSTLLMNNYIEFLSGDMSHNVGGLVGNASDIDIRNNYVYGSIKGSEQMGGLVAIAGSNVNIDHCYFVNGSATAAVGIDEFGATQNVTTFYGAGNQVRLDERVSGYNNLTRALNGWVKANNSDNQEFRTWRSDLDNVNNGYPLFGTPDVIHVYDTLVQTVCDVFDWDGIELNESGIYTVHIVDSLDYLDSTATLFLTVNYHDEMEIVDSVELFSDYFNYGFSYSAQQLMMMLANNRGAMVLNFTDTLQTVNGCDSIVNLTLHFYSKEVGVDEAQQNLNDVKVYPNPTRGIVHVEGSDIINVEVYDATSRCVLRKDVNADETVLDLSNRSTGSYYIRVNTNSGSVVKKLIKK